MLLWTYARVSVWTCLRVLCYVPGTGLQGPVVAPCLTVRGPARLSSATALSHVPPALCKGSGFPTSLPAFATSTSVLAVLVAVKGPQWGSELCSPPLAAVIPGACTGTSAEGVSFPGQQGEPLPPREGGLRPVLPRRPAGAAL